MCSLYLLSKDYSIEGALMLSKNKKLQEDSDLLVYLLKNPKDEFKGVTVQVIKFVSDKGIEVENEILQLIW